jgi:hypothetical protein
MLVRRARVIVIAVLCAVGCAPAFAARFGRAEVAHEAGRYQLDFVVDLAAATAPVRALLTDYDHLDRLSTHIVESRRPAGAHRAACLRAHLLQDRTPRDGRRDSR